MGSVIFPTNTLGKAHQVDVLSLYHHMDYLDNSWLASHSVTLMGMHALNNYAVIEPDGQGASPDSEQMTKENVQGDLVCLQMVDCILAALEVMRQEGVTLSAEGYINNWGTSLGACATTGFAQYMENDATPDLQMLFKLRASYIGAGPVKLSHIQGADYLMPNMPKQKYYEGWNPRLPFYMSTCPDDELIIYDDMKEYYTQLRTMPDGSVNPNVHWCDYKISPIAQAAAAIGLKNLEGMSGFSNHLLTAIVTLMAVSIAKDPADMEKILQAKNMFVTE